LGATGQQTPDPTLPETDDQVRERVPRAPGEGDQAYIARLDAARAERAAQVGEPTAAEVDEPTA